MRSARVLVGLVSGAILAISLTPLRSQGPFAQHTVHGHVFAAESGVPIANACITLDTGPDDALACTDSRGAFSIGIPEGAQRAASIEKTGYAVVHLTLQGEADIRLARGAAIAGRVTLDSGDPMSFMLVIAERRTIVDGKTQFVRETAVETNDAGTYRLFDLPSGQYIVGVAPRLVGVGRLRSDGDRPPQIFYPNTHARDQAQIIDVQAGEERLSVDLNVTSPPARIVDDGEPTRNSRLGVISGRVARADGTPMDRVQVELSRIDARALADSVATDRNGNYQFVGVRPGQYHIRANDRLLPAVAAFGQRGATGRGAVVSIAAGATLQHVDINFPPTSTIVGRVSDEYGDPLGHVTVRAHRVRWSHGRIRLTTIPGPGFSWTDDLGRFRIFGAAPGKYVVSASIDKPTDRVNTRAHLLKYLRTFFPGTLSSQQAQAIDLGEGEEALNVNFAMVAGHAGRIVGHAVTAEGLPFEGTVSLIASVHAGVAAEPPEQCRTNDGTFSFERVLPGEYVIQAGQARRSPSTEGQFGISRVVVSGSDTVDVPLRLSRGSSLRGRVNFDGDPPENLSELQIAAVNADADYESLLDNPVARAAVADDGSFEMSGLNGPRRLSVSRLPSGWALESILVDGLPITDGILTFGVSEQNLSNVDIVLTRAQTVVTGSVTDEARTPVADMAVIVFATDETLWYAHSRFVASAMTSGEGAFEIRGLPPATYFVAAFELDPDMDLPDQASNPALLRELSRTATEVTLSSAVETQVAVVLR